MCPPESVLLFNSNAVRQVLCLQEHEMKGKMRKDNLIFWYFHSWVYPSTVNFVYYPHKFKISVSKNSLRLWDPWSNLKSSSYSFFGLKTFWLNIYMSVI